MFPFYVQKYILHKEFTILSGILDVLVIFACL